MPQMSPMNWLNLMLFFIMILIIIMLNIHYFFNMNFYKPSLNKPLKTNMKKLLKIKKMKKNLKTYKLKIKW